VLVPRVVRAEAVAEQADEDSATDDVEEEASDA